MVNMNTAMNTQEQAQRLERERIYQILTHSSACGRESLARHLALKTNMSPPDAIEILRSTPMLIDSTPEAVA